ncbi:MAG: PmoA family protein [Planctomycetaceae bacterium]
MPYEFSRCEIVPLAGHQTSFRIDGAEKTRWHFGDAYPRPFFFPVNGPSGTSLTRMGHPGAPNHDHHRSAWFAHHKVLGIDFWSDNTTARIRQRRWLAYRDGDDEALMATQLHWHDGHNPAELLQQELVVAVRPGEKGEWELEVQCTFRPKADSLEFRKTNFGFFAVRVAKDLSGHFGGGRITAAHGGTGEKAIFGKPAIWVDYSGPVRTADKSVAGQEGVTYFDHPANPGHPLSWHVREDGWMGASICRNGAVTTTRKRPLVVRHLLHLHSGPIDRKRADAAFADFSKRPGFEVRKSSANHRQFEVRRRA